MERAITSEATPAVTPMTEITVITPITACRHLARRYRAATKSSNLMPPSQAIPGGSCGDPLKWQRHQRHAGLVFKVALPKSFFQFVFFNPDHQGKCSERADVQQNKAHKQPTAYGPACKIQEVGDIYRMAHAGVQSGGYQFLRMLLRAQLGFSAQLVCSKARAYAGVCPEAKEHQNRCRSPHPRRRIEPFRMPWPSSPSQSRDDRRPDGQQQQIW